MSDSFVTPWTAAHQAPLSVDFPATTLEWGAISSPGDLPNPGMGSGSPTLQADSLLSEPPGKPQEYWNGLPVASFGVGGPSQPRDQLYSDKTKKKGANAS